ncbi:hypothetical protein HaLaN_24537 [Haematococcus lacustris]|uniref:Uncharacterized protein n=1 Tax=Haematococcus lacustris TaxID=44745 RepID=A0A699ZUM1_HAELA|nr:hypothetical protein HaLaN_24537 [Haematococcus lacustris]
MSHADMFDCYGMSDRTAGLSLRELDQFHASQHDAEVWVQAPHLVYFRAGYQINATGKWCGSGGSTIEPFVLLLALARSDH